MGWESGDDKAAGPWQEGDDDDEETQQWTAAGPPQAQRMSRTLEGLSVQGLQEGLDQKPKARRVRP